MALHEKKNDELDEPEVLSKELFTGICPYCGSTEVQEGFIKFGFGAVAGNNNELPKLNKKAWHCLKCKEVFFVTD
ncbi:MAG: hypothetical protein RBR88_01520 [Candidatus Saccharicenans sp.]|nr:hypothetical protein [Candidatus Saccharicenans sp.]